MRYRRISHLMDNPVYYYDYLRKAGEKDFNVQAIDRSKNFCNFELRSFLCPQSIDENLSPKKGSECPQSCFCMRKLEKDFW